MSKSNPNFDVFNHAAGQARHGRGLNPDHGSSLPIAQLQQATRHVAAGNWNFVLDIRAKDEIGELPKNLGAMTQSLQASFAQVERSMDGFSLVLIEDYGDKLDEEGKDALQRIRAASQRMGNLIDDLLRLSQVTRAELNVTLVDLGAIARGPGH